MTKAPGLYASINNYTDPATNEVGNYISPAGIPSIANNTDQYHVVATPYGTWPIMLFDRGVGLAWWHNMVSGKKMQSKTTNPSSDCWMISWLTSNSFSADKFGSTEGFKIDGTGVSSMVTWDSKILTVVSLLGGSKDIVRDGMKKDGIYEDFLAQVNVRFHFHVCC